MGSNRRLFLKKSAALIGTASLLSSISEIRAAFREELATDNKITDEGLEYLYQIDPSITYLNHAALGTMPRATHEAHYHYLTLLESNPWLHMWSTPSQTALKMTRQKLANHIKGSPEQLALIHNTTEGFNVLAMGLPLQKGDEVLYSTLNHHCATACWQFHGARRGYECRRIELDLNSLARLTPEEFIECHLHEIRENTRVLVFPDIDNMIGYRVPADQLVQKARAKGVEYVLIDGAQTVGMFPINVEQTGADAYIASTHKWLQAAKGTGFMYLGNKLLKALPPIWVTGRYDTKQDSIIRFEDYNTHHIAEVLTLSDALDFQEQMGVNELIQYRAHLRRHFQNQVLNSNKLTWLSPIDDATATPLFAISVNGINSQRAEQELLKTHNYVIRAFNTPEFQGLRVSVNANNTRNDIDRLVRDLNKLQI